MTPAVIHAYNDGVRAVLAIAQRSAEAIATKAKRRAHEDFAIAALAEIAEAGRALLLPDAQVDQRGTRDDAAS